MNRFLLLPVAGRFGILLAATRSLLCYLIPMAVKIGWSLTFAQSFIQIFVLMLFLSLALLPTNAGVFGAISENLATGLMLGHWLKLWAVVDITIRQVGAQWIEHPAFNRLAVGSNPTWRTARVRALFRNRQNHEE